MCVVCVVCVVCVCVRVRTRARACVWKHAERSEGMLSRIEAKGLAQTC